MTAEVAIALPALLLVTTTLLLALVLTAQQVRCRDAASAVARAIARGESADAAQELARATAPSGARILVGSDADEVRVRVTWAVPVRAASVARLLPSAVADASAPREDVTVP